MQSLWQHKHCSKLEQNKSVQTLSLTGACCVHSNVYVLGDIHWIRYITSVDPSHSTSSTLQSYHHLPSGSVEIPLNTGKSSLIGKEPVAHDGSICITASATSTEVSCTEQCSTTFTNVLQGHETVVLVCCTIEWELDITCIWRWILCIYWKLFQIERLHNYSMANLTKYTLWYNMSYELLTPSMCFSKQEQVDNHQAFVY